MDMPYQGSEDRESGNNQSSTILKSEQHSLPSRRRKNTVVI